MNKIFTIIFILLEINFSPAQTIDWSMKANPALNSINSVAFRPDGQKVLSGTNCHPASIRLFDINTANLDWDYTVGSNYMCVMGVTFSSNNNYIAAIEEFGNIFVFDNTGPTPFIIDTINTGTTYGFSTAISPSNNMVAVGCSNGKLKIYNLPGGTLAKDITAHSNWVMSVCYSPNGNYIVTTGSDNKVKVWDNTGTLIHTLTGHSGYVTSAKVTPDNNFVVSASRDDKIKIWNINTGVLVQTINGHVGDINAVDVSPDGSKIVSASSDSTCKIWDFNTGSLITTFGVADSGKINAVAWSPNGNKIVTGNAKSDVTLWSIPASVGINEFESVSFNLQAYPNPFSTSATIFSEMKNCSVKITDITGNIVRTFSNANQFPFTFERGNLPSGIYVLELRAENKIERMKLVVN